MVTFDELNEQNHRITELSNVLLYLLSERSMCDTETACTLFYNYVDKVNDHLSVVDHLYAGLLSDAEKSTNDVAKNFMSGEQEIKKIMHKYTKKWCTKDHQALKIADHERFMADSEETFGLILKRIQDEKEKLYPLVRQIRGDSKRAA